MKLIIDRSKWYRGYKEGSMLVRGSDSKMCCLGFLGILCGGDPNKDNVDNRTDYSENGMRNQTMPNKAQSFWPLWLFANYCEGSEGSSAQNVSQELAIINDENNTDEFRETAITKIMKQYGDVDVEFIDQV